MRVRGFDQRDLGTAQLRRQREPVAQRAHLVDHDLAAQLVALVVGDEADVPEVGVGAGLELAAAAARAAGLAVGAGRGAQQPARQPQRDLAFAHQRRAHQQQRVAEPALRQRAGGLRVLPLLPGREFAHGRFPSHARRAATAASRTASAGWLASITRKRAGSAAARAR